jgi:hypothetical protein
MRNPHLLIVSLLFIFPAIGISQYAGIDEALKKGDAKALGIYFSSSLDLSIPGNEQTLTADKAVKALSQFFDKESVKGYKKMHTSAPQEGRSNFTIGDLYTGQGTYRITLFFNKEHKISEVEIRK